MEKLIDKLKPRKGVHIVKLLHVGSLTLQLDSEVDRQAEAKKGGSHCKTFTCWLSDPFNLIVKLIDKLKPRKGVLIVKRLQFGSLTLQLDSEVDRQVEAKKGATHCKTFTFWLSDPST